MGFGKRSGLGTVRQSSLSRMKADPHHLASRCSGGSCRRLARRYAVRRALSVSYRSLAVKNLQLEACTIHISVTPHLTLDHIKEGRSVDSSPLTRSVTYGAFALSTDSRERVKLAKSSVEIGVRRLVRTAMMRSARCCYRLRDLTTGFRVLTRCVCMQS